MNREYDDALRRGLESANASAAVWRFPAVTIAELLLPTFLNNGVVAKESRVFELIRYCREAEVESRKIGPPPPKEPFPEMVRRRGTLLDLLERINSILINYRFFPLVIDYPRLAPKWVTDSEILDTPGVKVGEPEAVQAVLELLAAGRLDRLRQCVCNRWFFAHSNKKLVCSAGCRFRKYQDKQSVKEKRREYMRKYNRNPRVRAKLERKRQAAKGQRSP